MTTPRRRGLTELAADAAVDTACRMLRLPTIRAQFEDMAEVAEREQMNYRGFLAELLMAECATAPAAATNDASRPPGSYATSRCAPSTSTSTPHRRRHDSHPGQMRMDPKRIATVFDRRLFVDRLSG